MRRTLKTIAGAALLAIAALSGAPALSQPTIALQPPTYVAPNGTTTLYFSPAAILGRDSVTGAPCWVATTTTCQDQTTGGGGGGGGGAVTAAAGAYALGAIVDLGTGATPGQYTTNGYLASLKAGVTITSGTVTLGAGSAAIGSISNTSFAATQATAANLNATVVGTGTFAVQATGNVGGYDTTPNAIPSLSTSAYATGAALGGTQTLTLARTNGGSGIITALELQSKQGATNTIWVYAFQKSPSSTCSNQTTFSFNSADRPYLIPGFPLSVTLASPGSWDTASYGSVLNLTANFKNQDTTPGQSIYFCLVTSAAVTPTTAGDLLLTVGLPQD